jgi:DNA (cytosine-5)-methyltransferase 1
MSTRKRTYLTVTDLFCGAGGSSLGAKKAGLEVEIASNHWKLAVETHASNFPDTEHDCADVSQVHPRRYRSTDILIASPECTTHSPAGGSRRLVPQRDLFKPAIEDDSAIRSRATAFDVVKFAAFHRYRIIIVENVFEFVRWELFHDWLQMFATMGYEHRVVSINSMFCHPTPQSRDRVYVVFWQKGNRPPTLDLRPLAFCARCERNTRARQAWKNGRTIGKYRQQYVYVCSRCRTDVQPYYFAALNAIDFGIAAERIGDRQRPLKERTLERIRFGLEKYGRRALVVNVKQPARDSSRAWPADAREIGTVPTWDDYYALAHPTAFLIAGQGRRDVYSTEDPLRAQLATSSHDALVVAPFLVNGHMSRRVYGVDEPMAAQAASREHDSLVIPPAFLSIQRSNNRPAGLHEAIPALCTGNHHMLIQGAALLSLRDTSGMHVGDLSEPTMTQGTRQQAALISRAPFIVEPAHLDKNDAPYVRSADRELPTQSTIERHGLVAPDESLDVEDCYFRMLQPHEIGRAMAFPDQYVVLGTKRDRVKQYGNAVTPPVMDFLIRRCVESLHPERVA